MIVFNNYFKIVKQNLSSILLFVFIAIIISVMNTSYSTDNDFINKVLKVSIINLDNSTLVENFTKYIDNNSTLIEIDNSDKAIQDALYKNKVDVVIIIKEDFTKDLLNNNKPLIEIKKSGQSIYIEMLINKYLKLAETYSKLNMSEIEIVKSIESDLENEITVLLKSNTDSNISKLALFYNFQSYAFLSIFLLIVGTIMCIFNKDTIKNRNIISSLSKRSFSNQLFLGHLTMTLILWFVFIIIGIVIYGNLMFNMNSLLLIISSLIFAFTATSLAYLIATFIKKEAVLEGMQSIIPLGLSFMSGVFVPAEFLDQNIVNVSKIFPVYWFVETNFMIVDITSFDFETLKPILLNYIIILSFGIFYLLISNALPRKKK